MSLFQLSSTPASYGGLHCGYRCCEISVEFPGSNRNGIEFGFNVQLLNEKCQCFD